MHTFASRLINELEKRINNNNKTTRISVTQTVKIVLDVNRTNASANFGPKQSQNEIIFVISDDKESQNIAHPAHQYNGKYGSNLLLCIVVVVFIFCWSN